MSISLDALLSNLKPRQLEAVRRVHGPQLILAGAGTGKTTTITAKIAYMIEKEGIDPARILALTFSNEAARNMREKVEELLQGKEVHVSTFHSFCSGIIRENAERCGVPHDFNIFEEIDSAIFMHRELGVDVRNAALYANTISKAKDLNISIPDFKNYLEKLRKKVLDKEADEAGWDELFREYRLKLYTFHLQTFSDREDKKSKNAEKRRYKEFITSYEEYRKYSNFISAWERYETKKSGALDFGDLNRIALEYLDMYGTGELNETFRYIIIDEFQDTNYVQFELIKKLTVAEKNITVVADPNQTIYAFRGAYTNNIEEFKRQFKLKEKDIVTLDISFRSTNKILRVSHSLIEKNYAPEKKDECQLLMNNTGSEGKNIIVIETEDENEEARAVVEHIEDLQGEVPPSEIAVLYRTHSQGRKIREALENRGLQFRIKDESDFLKQPEIKTALAYLYVINNISHPTPRGTEAWWRIFHYNHFLGPGDSIKIGEFVKKNRVSFQEAIYDHIDELCLSGSGLETVNSVKKKITTLCRKKILDVSDLVLEVYDLSGLSRQFSQPDMIRNREALLNLRQLYEMARKFEEFHGKDLSMFIDYLEVLDEMGGNPQAARIQEKDAINLMTIHAAKGLEFRVVFLVCMAEGKFPLYRGGREPIIPPELMEQYRDIFERDSPSAAGREISERKKEIKKEEERRLAYVAFTRAKEHLFLTRAIKYADSEKGPSEFLTDIGYSETDTSAADITRIRDTEIKAKEMIKDSDVEREKTLLKGRIMESLDSDDLSEVLKNVLLYKFPKSGKEQENKTGLMFNPAERTFSVTSINTYERCPRQYELAELLRMPARVAEFTSGVMNTGSFIHKVLEMAVKEKITEKERLHEIRDSLAKEPEWRGVDISKTTGSLDVFWERNKNTIASNLMVEKRFTVNLDGFIFKGFIDRIDLIPGTMKEVEIIDYKTGKNVPGPAERSKQLLLYARGLEHTYPEYKVRKLTLELLAHPVPMSFVLKNGKYESLNNSRIDPLDGNAVDAMIETAKRIAHDYEHGFVNTDDENACRDCGYKLYCSRDTYK